MSAAVVSFQNELDESYADDFGRGRETMKSKSRFPESRRQGHSAPRSGGMHCRRQKKWTWGRGHGARLLDLKAFAGCLAVGLAAIASITHAAPINPQMVMIENPGNQGKAVTTSGVTQVFGSVNYRYQIGKFETTNADYAAFLNSVDPTGNVNPSGIYNPSMGTDTVNGGIIRTPGSGYSVRSGFANKPVTYVNWFDAARFVNWLNNGQSGTSSINSGAYTLTTSQTSGALVPRNPNATVFLPSANEWFKAAYYNPALSGTGGYYTYATGNNSAPTATVSNLSLANAANFGGNNSPAITTGVLDVGAYTNTMSSYGVFGMFGNVLEMTDTAGGSVGQWYTSGPSWRMNTSQVATWGSNTTRFMSNVGDNSTGFRIAAVPEPGSVVLAVIGIGGMLGCEVVRRRKRQRSTAVGPAVA